MSTHRPQAPWLLACVFLLLALLSGGGLANDRIEWKTRGPGAGGNMVYVSVSPANPKIVLMGSDTGGIVRSVDGGLTWQMRNDALVHPGRFASYPFRSFAWIDPNIVYSGTLKSTDAGFTWHETVNNPYIHAGISAIDPVNHDVVYTIGDGAGSFPMGFLTIYRTDCAWDKPSCTNPQQPYITSIVPLAFAHVRSLVVDPNSQSLSHLFLCTDQGIWESTFNVPNATWSKVTTPVDDCNNLKIATNGDLFAVFETQCKCPNQPEGNCTSLSCGWREVESWKGGVYKSSYSAGSQTWGAWTSLNEADDADILANLNPGFEDQSQSFPIHWVNGGQTTWECNNPQWPAHTDQCSMKMNMAGTVGAEFDSDPIAVQADTIYRLSAWGRMNYPGCPDNTRTLHAQLYFWTDTQGTVPMYWPGGFFNTMNPWLTHSLQNEETGGWRKFESLFRVPATAQSVTLKFFTVPDGGPCTGSTWVDDVSIVPTHGLPKVAGSLESPSFTDFGPLVLDPTDPDSNTIYVGTRSGTANLFGADTLGVWKSHLNTTLQRIEWDLVTRTSYRDNVLDGVISAPQCGNGRCEGRGENCTTCPKDCTSGQNPGMIPTAGCCGDHTCVTGEHGDNTGNLHCLVDCPWEPDPNRVGVCTAGTRAGLDCSVTSDCPGSTCDTSSVPYYEQFGSLFTVWDLSIGSGASGHNTVYAASVQGYVTTNGGAKWTEVSSDHQINATPPFTTWRARGDTNAVLVSPVVTVKDAPGRVYYGDRDNSFKVSFDSGQTFSTEGHDWEFNLNPPVLKGAVHSILLDANDSSGNTVYCGVSADDLGQPDTGGVVKGVFNPNPTPPNKPWTWTAVGNQDTFPKGGRVELVRDDQGSFYAAIWGQGVFKLNSDLPTAPWSNCPPSCPAQSYGNWDSPPTGWEVYNIALEPVSQRLYVSAGGFPTAGSSTPDRSGIWASDDRGANWTKISASEPALSGTVIDFLVPNGRSTLLVAAEGLGVYRGTLSGSTWSWGTAVLDKPQVSGLAISPLDSSLVYAFSGQLCCFGTSELSQPRAGIWKSTNGGKSGSWGSVPLPNDSLNSSLMFLKLGRLSFSAVAANPRTLYASTGGAGVFEGSVLCSDPTREFECATRVNASSQGISPGSVVSGQLQDLSAATFDDTYETLRESTSGTRRLTATWTFSTALAGVDYKVRVEGAKLGTSSDTFTVSVLKKTGACSGSESGYTNLFDLPAQDEDDVQVGSAGKLTGSQNTFCVRLKDGSDSDSITDSVIMDRVYLLPTSPPPETVAATDEPQGSSPGIILSGSYLDTRTSDDRSEALQETLQSGNSRLTHVWKFTGVPTGASHLLHVEGHRPANTELENFQFAFSTDGTSYTNISGALINTEQDVTGGTNYTFGTGSLSGTVYIRVTDTNTTGAVLDTLYVDHLTILTVP